MKSAQELAASLGVNEATLRLWRAEAGIGAKARNVGYTDDEIAQIEAIAANKRKSKPRKNDIRANIPHISADSLKKPTISANTPTDTIAKLDGSSAHIDANTRYEGMYSAQLERIESKIDALMALLDKGVIASRYIARKDVESALSDSAKSHTNTRPMRGNLPPGTDRLSMFAGLHGVPPRTARDQAVAGKYTVTTIGTNGSKEYYVEPSQRAGVVAFWQRTGYPYTKCPQCPHTQEAQEHE